MMYRRPWCTAGTATTIRFSRHQHQTGQIGVPFTIIQSKAEATSSSHSGVPVREGRKLARSQSGSVSPAQGSDAPAPRTDPQTKELRL